MKKVWAVLGLGLIVVAGVIVLLLRDRTRGPSRYNILLITLDTTRADHLGCYGRGEASTPTLDALATAGVLFEQAYSCVPLTLPSHATILTGLYPPEHGLKINGAKRLNKRFETLAEVLEKAGYETGAFVGAFALDSKFGLDQGFDRYDDDLSEAYEQEIREPNSLYRAGDLVTESALAWLKERGKRPFFCWVHLYDPHKPYHPHGSLSGTRFSEQRSYDAEIAFVDQQVGRLVAFLKNRGWSEKTLVIAVGDHGEGLGAHGEPDHGYMLYATTLRVPLIFSLPGTVRCRSRIGSLVSLVDVGATVLDLIGVEGQEAVSGRSLVDGLLGRSLASSRCYSETDLPYSYFGWGPLRSLTTERWKYIRSPRVELYDRRADPNELHNLAGVQSEVTEEMEARLAAVAEEMQAGVAENVALEAEEARRLKSLGYLGGGREVDAQTLDLRKLKDIKDMLPVVDMMWRMLKLMGQGEVNEAVRLCREMVEISPESPRFQCYLADALGKRGELDEAMVHYKEALRLDPGYREAYSNMGLALSKLGRLEEAVLHFRQALTIDPQNAETHYNLGVALMKAGQKAAALSEFREAVRVRPEYADARMNLGLILARTGQDDEAIVHLTEAVRLRPDSAKAHYNLGLALMQAGQYAESAKHYREALRIDPGSAMTRNNLGIALSRQGKVGEAVEQYRAALQIHPKHAGAMSNLAWLLATSADASVRDGEESVRLAKEATSLRGEADVGLLDVLAAAQAEAGQFEAAAATAKRAISLAQGKGQASRVADLQKRLDLYQKGKPYRQEPAGSKGR